MPRSQEKNRTAVVALNAEIRHTKAKLLEEDLPKLQRVAVKKKKCLNSELWHVCASPLVCLPTVGMHVIYFPQGHSEQLLSGYDGLSFCGVTWQGPCEPGEGNQA